MRHLGGKTKKRVAKRRGNTRRNKRRGGAGFSISRNKEPLVISYKGGDRTLTRTYLANELHIDPHGVDLDFVDFGDIHIGEGWTAIGAEALNDYPGGIKLTRIAIPASLTSIGNAAFYNCNALETVTFAENSQLTAIGDQAFRFCVRLTTIAIPASVKTIGNEAFNQCTALERITFAENSQLNTIGDDAFYFCGRLTTIAIPASVTTIGNNAFYNCNTLERVTFADHSKITNIHDDSFAYCNNLTTVEISKETINWWNSHNPTAEIRRGPNQQFLGHTVNIVAIADVVTRRSAIASVAQAGTNARLIEGAQFGPDAPRGVGLKYELDPLVPRTTPTVPRKRVQLPMELGLYIDKFLGGKTKKRVAKRRGNTRRNKRVGGAGFSAGGKKPLVISYKDGDSTLTRTYLATRLLDVLDIHIGEGWTAIGKNALESGRINLKTISIPESVTSIGSYAFYKCGALETVTFAENSQLTAIGDDAFRSCDRLTTIAIPASVTTIGNNAFMRDEALETVTFAENSQLTAIGDAAFSLCYRLTTIAIPASVTTIGPRAFIDCNALDTVTFAENSQLTTIGSGVFEACDRLTTIAIPASVTTIGPSAFIQCRTLERVTFADHSKITNIHDDSFAQCDNLTTVEISKETIKWWNSHNPTAQIKRGPNQQFLGRAVNIVAIADVVARRTALASVAQAGPNARLIEGAQFGPDAPRGVGYKYELNPNIARIDPDVPRTRVQLPTELGLHIAKFLGGKTKKRYKKSSK